ncbi:type II secretion system minor pseudopilin GspK [Hydrogenophaga sp. OTU3427]|uniref:type II secretion system minor pseudopilin GspK n=1 Tax=Hydrogenophaga sp. OTU3427 TaxID=3043856 RepID=UPI00313ACF37
MSRAQHPHQRGAALLMAMLTVALVATLSTAALWHQWRALAVERAERARVQASWVLGGALDWARLILREDQNANRNEPADHLGEPWALPLAEARLSSFLAADRNQNADNTLEAFLSGEITDQQGRLNLYNLVQTSDGKAIPSAADVTAFERLFQQLGLSPGELALCLMRLQAALDQTPAGRQRPGAPLLPSRWSQLGWLGLSAPTLRALAPHATWLPQRTALNLNTASAEALFAALPGTDMALARQLVVQRATAHFPTVADVKRRFPQLEEALAASDRFQTTSRFFEVRGRLRLDDTVVEEVSLVDRGGSGGQDIQTLWRERRRPGGSLQ